MIMIIAALVSFNAFAGISKANFCEITGGLIETYNDIDKSGNSMEAAELSFEKKYVALTIPQRTAMTFMSKYSIGVVNAFKKYKNRDKLVSGFNKECATSADSEKGYQTMMNYVNSVEKLMEQMQ